MRASHVRKPRIAHSKHQRKSTHKEPPVAVSGRSIMRNLLAASLAVALASVPHHHAAAISCKSLTDEDSNFIHKFPAALNGSFMTLYMAHVEEIFGPLDSSFPWISKCIASFDSEAVAISLLTHKNIGKCLRAMNDTSGSNYSSIDDAFLRNSWCPTYKEKWVPCLTDVVLPTFDQAVADSGGCCDDMKSSMLKYFNTTTSGLVNDMIKLVGNVICSVKHYKDTNSSDTKLQSCGESLVSTYNSNIQGTLEGLLQLPNSQACIALSGLDFKTSNDTINQLVPPVGEPKIGICFKPIDTLLQYIHNWPLMKMPLAIPYDTDTIVLDDLFNATKCVNGTKVMDLLLSNASVVMDMLLVADETMELAKNMMSTKDTVSPSLTVAPTNLNFTATTANMNFTAMLANMSFTGSWTGSFSGSWPSQPFTPTLAPVYGPGNFTTFVTKTVGSYVNGMKTFCMHVPTAISCAYGSGAMLVIPFNVDVATPAPTTVTMKTIPKSTGSSVGQQAMVPLVVGGVCAAVARHN